MPCVTGIRPTHSCSIYARSFDKSSFSKLNFILNLYIFTIALKLPLSNSRDITWIKMCLDKQEISLPRQKSAKCLERYSKGYRLVAVFVENDWNVSFLKKLWLWVCGEVVCNEVDKRSCSSQWRIRHGLMPLWCKMNAT